MPLKNSATAWGTVARTFHWLGAVLIITLIALGFWMGELVSIQDKIYYINLHKSLGLIALVLAVLRLLWRFVSPPPVPLAAPLLAQIAARAVHVALYVFFIVQPLVGIVHSWATGYPIVFFNSFPLPALMAPNRALADILGTTHVFIGWGLVALIALHGAAALKHHFIDRDQTLIRMLSGTGDKT